MWLISEGGLLLGTSLQVQYSLNSYTAEPHYSEPLKHCNTDNSEINQMSKILLHITFASPCEGQTIDNLEWLQKG